MKPLKSKKSSEVAKYLKKIYIEHGQPRVLQSDRGGEFRKSVAKLMKSLKVKVIKSSPYRPQTQGKVERSHRSFRKKVLYDLLTMTTKGVNWAKELPTYASSMNDDAKEELNWKTPFEIYYGRRNNRLVFPADNSSWGKHAVQREKHDGNYMPTENDRKGFCKNRKQWHKSAKIANDRCVDRMIKRALKLHPPAIREMTRCWLGCMMPNIMNRADTRLSLG
jgi:transposase InsO family protein